MATNHGRQVRLHNVFVLHFQQFEKVNNCYQHFIPKDLAYKFYVGFHGKR